LRVRVRRLRCTNNMCTRAIFAERLPALAAVKARRSDRLRTIQQEIGLALGGQPAARLSQHLALPVSTSTVLRLIRAKPIPAPETPRVVGIDDWAWRRGTRYGTIICDLERGRVIDLLPDREADTVADWLRHHPGIEVVARDRAGAYADAVRRGAPEARQVADRWHVLRNLGDALQTAAEKHRKGVRAAALRVAGSLHAEKAKAAPKPQGTAEERQRAARRQRRQDMYDDIVRLHDRDLTKPQIASAVGLSVPAIYRWLKAGGPPRHHKPPKSRFALSRACVKHLETRWAEGCRNATRLWRELRQRGLKASERTVRRWAQDRRHGPSTLSEDPVVLVAAAWPAPSKRRCARLLTMTDAELDANERAFVTHLAVTAPKLIKAAELAKEFSAMIKNRTPEALDPWLKAAVGTELASFAQGLERDGDAVRAALAEPWSTSPVEGQINRLKMLKRQMYGRAKYDLLRCRVLAA
jgi:transposase